MEEKTGGGVRSSLPSTIFTFRQFQNWVLIGEEIENLH